MTIARFFFPALYSLLIALTSCTAAKETDISNEGRVKHLMNQKLIIKQDLFLHQYSDTGEYRLAVPGTFSELPVSVQGYERNPTGWNTDPEYKQAYRGFEISSTCYVLGVLRAGTVVAVTKVIQRKNRDVDYVVAFVRLPNDQAEREWSISTLLYNGSGPEASPTLKTQFIDFAESN